MRKKSIQVLKPINQKEFSSLSDFKDYLASQFVDEAKEKTKSIVDQKRYTEIKVNLLEGKLRHKIDKVKKQFQRKGLAKVKDKLNKTCRKEISSDAEIASAWALLEIIDKKEKKLKERLGSTMSKPTKNKEPKEKICTEIKNGDNKIEILLTPAELKKAAVRYQTQKFGINIKPKSTKSKILKILARRSSSTTAKDIFGSNNTFKSMNQIYNALANLSIFKLIERVDADTSNRTKTKYKLTSLGEMWIKENE